jgi:tetratricopeptide (TPR) repeat protein
MVSNNIYVSKLLKESQRLYKSGELAPAKKVCSEALRMESKNFDLLYLLASIELKLNNLTRAKDLLIKASEINPNDPSLENNLGIALSSLMEHEAALIHFNRAITLNKDFYWAYSNAGSLLIQQKKYEEAIIFLNRAVSISPDYADAHFNLGIAHHSLQDLKSAIKSYEAAYKFKPSLVDAKKNFDELVSHLNSKARENEANNS